MATNVEEMVKKHVLVNANQLVNELNNREEFAEALFPVTTRDDFETPAREAGYQVVKSDTENEFYLIHPNESGKRLEDDTFFTTVEAWEEACSLEGIDPYLDEAYEHYIVSDLLAYQLEKRGEMIIIDFLGLTIWGRATTGQMVYMDDVMVDIAKNTNIK